MKIMPFYNNPYYNPRKSPYFAGYKSSKYAEKSYTTNTLLDSKTSPDAVLEDVDIKDDDSMQKYSTKRLEALYTHFGLFSPKLDQKARDNVRRQLNITLQRLNGCGLDASNLDMLTRLVEDKKLSLQVLAPLNKDYKISSNVSDDLDRLYSAYIENKDVKSAFVPEFKSEDEALLSLKTGDVCQISGEENIRIKSPNDSMQKLFITGDTYLELFPPVERFITTQQDVGDCYLLSAINGIYNNPSSRHKVLEMFRQNPDDTVDIVFGGFIESGGEIVPKNPENDILYDISPKILESKKDYALSATSEGIRAIEILNEFERQNFMNKWLVERYDIFKEKGTNAPCCSFRPYTDEEIKYFINYVDNYGPGSFFCLQSLISLKMFTLSRKEIEEKLEELKGMEDDDSKYKTLILQRWLKKMDKTGAPAYDIFGEDIPRKFVFDLFKDISNANLYCNNSGHSTDIFERFGFDVIFERANIQSAKEALFDPDKNKYIFTVSGKKDIEETSKGKFIPSHAYSLEPVDKGKERKFAIKNPHNSSEEIILSYEELEKYFAKINAAKI